MSMPILAYILFAVITLGLMVCIAYISHLRHQNSELRSTVMEQNALLDLHDRLVRGYDEYIRELSVQLKAASEDANEYRATLRHIDNQLQSDPIQFLFTA